MTSAAGAAGNGGGGGDAGPAQGEGGGGEAFDAAGAFAQLRDGQETQQQLLQQLMDGRATRGEADSADEADGDGDLADGLDLSYLDDPAGDEYDGAQDGVDGVDLDQLARDFGEGAAEAAAAAVEPVHRELQQLRSEQQELRAEQGFRDLAAEFPELQDAEAQQAVFSTAQALVNAGQLPGDAAYSPHVIRLVFLAHRAMEMQQAEEAIEQVPAAHLEGGTGASPGGAPADPADEIFKAGPLGKGVLDFG
jgi:hypothetical protein